ncbi:MAG: 50S ribosomal protein L18 [Candidatus Methanomethylicia archaeon]|nr:50S ribosomal protein L18 [Candidatus Methanomethylicia archaeon]MDW7988692.1 50S ribosomal protein L18 [Nitrososphaerota archaeon]
MIKKPQYKVPFRRRREGLTDYRRRLKLVISGRPRLVVRKTNRYVIAQIIEAKIGGDKTIVSACTKELEKYGWKYSFKNIPACYLLGLVVGYRAIKAGLREAILDLGLHRPTKGSKVFAVAKGALDAGLKVPISIDIIPDNDRISGKHIKEYMDKIISESWKNQFSNYIKREIKPEDIVKDFEKIKNKIKVEVKDVGRWK